MPSCLVASRRGKVLNQPEGTPSHVIFTALTAQGDPYYVVATFYINLLDSTQASMPEALASVTHRNGILLSELPHDSIAALGGFTTIADAADACRTSFKQCLAYDSLRREWAEDRLADFNVWDSSIGASAEMGGYLDARLGSKFNIQQTLLGLVTLLQLTVDQCKHHGIEYQSEVITVR
jgi:hypothetical protein